MEEKKTKKGRKNKNTEESLCCLPCFNERTTLTDHAAPTDHTAPTGAFFYAILMIINWQWLMASSDVTEDMIMLFYPIHFSYEFLFLSE